MNGRKMMKISQMVFFPPPMSRRRNTSLITMISIQNQITHAKMIRIVQRTSRKG
jgi:hypothetical protein